MAGARALLHNALRTWTALRRRSVQRQRVCTRMVRCGLRVASTTLTTPGITSAPPTFVRSAARACGAAARQVGECRAARRVQPQRSGVRGAPVEGCAVVYVHLRRLGVRRARWVRVRQQALQRHTRSVSHATSPHTCSAATQPPHLNARQQRAHVVDGAPLVLDDIHAQRPVRVDCGAERRTRQRAHQRVHSAADARRQAPAAPRVAPATPHAPFGWKTSLVNRTRGGFSGYCSEKVMRSENTPPWRGTGARLTVSKRARASRARRRWSSTRRRPCGRAQARREAAAASAQHRGSAHAPPRASRPARRSWRPIRTGCRRCVGMRCSPAHAAHEPALSTHRSVQLSWARKTEGASPRAAPA